jgi:hypothetical protein
MIWPPQNTGVFAPGLCVVCCAVPNDSFSCFCSISNYTVYSNVILYDYAGAENFLDGSALAAIMANGKIVMYGANDKYFSNYSVDETTPNQVTISGTSTHINIINGEPFIQFWASLALKKDSILTIENFIFSPNPTDPNVKSATLYECNNTFTFIESVQGNALSSPFSFVSLENDGEYLLILSASGDYEEDSHLIGELESTVSSDDTMIVNRGVAIYSDDVPEDYSTLEAFPKLKLPPLTESSGDWYIDEGAAQTVIDDLTSNCIAYIETLSANQSITATEPSSDLYIVFTDSTNLPAASPYIWCSINVINGETLSFDYVHYIGGTISIYNYNGVLVESLSGSTSSITSSAVPYHGRYIIKLLLNNETGGPFTNASVTITSSDTMSVNQISAAYDLGLTCPAYLDCV